MMLGTHEHADPVTDARASIRTASTLLPELPESFADDRERLHRIARELLAPKAAKETGGRVRLRYTPDGFGTDPWPGEHTGQARLEGKRIVLEQDGRVRSVPACESDAAAGLLGVEPPEPPTGPVSNGGAAAVASWFALATVALGELIHGLPEEEAATIERPRLWHDRFELSTSIGGASPGDADHAEPFLFLPTGAELGYEELRRSEDPIAAAVRFFRTDTIGR